MLVRLIFLLLPLLGGCALVNGKKIKFDANQFGLADPFFIVSKEVYPEHGRSDFVFPIKITLNSTVYQKVTVAQDSHFIKDVTPGRLPDSTRGDRCFVAADSSTSETATQQDRSYHSKRMEIRFTCPDIKPHIGHDYNLNIKLVTTSKSNPVSPQVATFPLALTISYDGVLTSALVGTGLTVFSVYLGLLLAESSK
jgi:hypothetical protein